MSEIAKRIGSEPFSGHICLSHREIKAVGRATILASIQRMLKLNLEETEFISLGDDDEAVVDVNGDTLQQMDKFRYWVAC